MLEYLFAIFAFAWCVVQLPYPSSPPYPMFKTITLLVAMILIIFAVFAGAGFVHPRI